VKIETVAIGSISPDPANLRKHGARNLDAIKASMRRFGQQTPIVVDSRGIILAGHGRFEAAKALGWAKIKVVRSSLKGSEAIAYGIADNRTAELAEWDGVALAETLRALQSEDFELDSTGFTDEDVTAMLQKLGSEILEPGDEGHELMTSSEEDEHFCPKCKFRWTG
jgi:ParB-like chromosome segregation protein Spo0J